MLERLLLFCINIFCPPLTVMILAGPSTDCIINTVLFIAGVIPGHIHGFYISCTYFHRKRKVKKGKWPGGKKRGIYSRIVWNGGASDERVEELWVREMEKRREKEGRRWRRRSSVGGRGDIRSDIRRERSMRSSRGGGSNADYVV